MQKDTSTHRKTTQLNRIPSMKIGGIFIPILRRMTMRLKKDKIEEPTPVIEPTEIIAPQRKRKDAELASTLKSRKASCIAANSKRTARR